MQLFQAKKISFRFDAFSGQLFDQIDFQIHADSRIGLIGANGTGKSTLLRLLRGELQPDQGKLTCQTGIRLGYLPQQPLENAKGLAVDQLWKAHPQLERLRRLLLDPATSGPACVQALETYESLGGYVFEQRLDRLMAVFGWNDIRLQQEVASLSGGEKTRLALFQLMLAEPGLLLLDEPTNHLDQPMLDWLEDFLVSTTTPWILVSHDRHLLEGCVESIWELEAGKLIVRRGNYSNYQRQQTQERAHQEMLYLQQRKKASQLKQVAQQRRQLGQNMEDFKPSRSVRKNGGICKRDDGSGQAQVRTRNLMRAAKAAEHRAEKAQEAALALRPVSRRELRLVFRSRPLRVRQVLLGLNLSCIRGDKQIFEGLDVRLAPRERLAITGPNGSGKSSLLEILAGRLPPATGQVQWADGLRLGYLAQHTDKPNGKLTVLESVLGQDPARTTLARMLLAQLGIRAAQMQQPVARLSSGESSKVALAALIAAEPEVLLLDEPTNHLELSAREALETALQDYPGTLIVVSHDRWFREALSCQEITLGG